MPKIEVDEEQVRADAALRATIAKITSNPKGKLLLQEAHKLVDPENARTPELDMQAAIHEPVSKLEAKIDKFMDEQKADREKRERDDRLAKLAADQAAGLTRLRSSGKWTDEGIAAVEKLMAEKGILDVDIAAAAIEKQMPAAVPVTPRGHGGWNFVDMTDETDADLKKLVETKGQSEPLIDRMAQKALAEVRAR